MTQEHHSLDKNNGTRGGYPHGTIGANRALARKDFDEMIKARGLIKCSDDIQITLHTLEAFCNAWRLTTMSRTANADNTTPVIWEQFIAIYVWLEENTSKADELLRDSKANFKSWPRKPDIKFGPDAGWCAWNVAYKFSHRILSAVLFARATSLGEQFGMQFGEKFAYLMLNDPCIGKWLNAFIEELGTRTLPLSAEWPVWQINRDAESVRNQLEVEIESVRLGLSDRRKSVQQTAKKGKSQPQKLSAKARALAILVEHQDWSDTKIAKEAGINRTTLYNYPEFKAARKMQKQNKGKIPRGSKDREGNVEAIDE
jgi:hypothetical protein